MKKLLCIVCLLLVGCSTTISKDKYEQLVQENEILKKEINDINNKNDDLTTQIKVVEKELEKYQETTIRISGGFVATLRHLMPDYNVDDRVLGIAVVNWFQGETFVVRIDDVVANKLEIGETYYFEIEERVLDGYTLEEVEASVYSDKNMIKVIGYRQPKDDELGLGSPGITIEKTK